MDNHLDASSTSRSVGLPGRIRGWLLGGALLPHLLLLVVGLIVIATLVRPGDVWTSDEGAVRAQVEVLHTTGGWSAERPFAEIDPEEILTPIHGASIEGDRFYPYTKQAVLPALLSTVRVFGDGAPLIVFSLVGTVVCAVAAWMVGERIDRTTRNVSLWVVGLFTPAFVYGFTVLGHTMGAAAAGLLVALLLRHRHRASPWWIAIAALAAFSVMLRAEALLYALAVAGATVVESVLRRRRSGIELAIIISVAAVGAAALNAWIDVSLGGATIEEGEAILDAFRLLSGAFSSLLLVDFGTPVLAAAVIAIATASALLVVAVRREPANTVLHRALMAAGYVGVLLLATEMPTPVGGLIAAVPLLLCGLLVLPAHVRRSPDVALVLGASAAFVVLVLATQERGGGGIQWGGRYFLVMLPALIPVAVAGLAELLRTRPAEARRALMLIAVTSLVLAVNAVWMLNDRRGNSVMAVERMVATATAASAPTGSDPVLVSIHTQIGRHAWRYLDEVDFLLIPRSELDTYLDRLATASRHDLGYFGAGTEVELSFRANGWELVPYRWPSLYVARVARG